MSTHAKPSDRPRKSSAARTRAYRERLKAKGLKPRTIWTYDTSDPAFLAQLRTDVERLRASESEKEVLGWLEAIQREDGLWD